MRQRLQERDDPFQPGATVHKLEEQTMEGWREAKTPYDKESGESS